MAYDATIWAKEDLITAERMNKLEQGVVEANLYNYIVVEDRIYGNDEGYQLNKTFEQIFEALNNGAVFFRRRQGEGYQESILDTQAVREFSPVIEAYKYLDNYYVIISSYITIQENETEYIVPCLYKWVASSMTDCPIFSEKVYASTSSVSTVY